MSGEALHSTQCTPSSDRAMDDWVRGVARRVPSRKPLQLTQLQFHCGNPPPAAEPRTWMYMATLSAETVAKKRKRPGRPRR
ncbi:hypothetical protein D3C81_764910 [compost metagenome]